jgi:ubiquitin C-terminal hydrolase
MWIQPLVNKNDSCYIDTVLIALFIDPQNWIIRRLHSRCHEVEMCGTKVPRRTVKKIRDKYRQVASKISRHNSRSHRPVKIEAVRNISTLCPLLNNKERFDQKGMNDPAVYLEFILNLFPCEDGKNSPEKVVYLNTGPLKKLHNTYVGDLVQKQNLVWDTQCDHVILDITRLNSKGKYVPGIRIYPEECLQFENGPELLLHAIIVWVNFHYTVYAIVGDQWFYFDDTTDAVKPIGSYKKLLSQSYKTTKLPSPLTDAKLYFYSKMN